jgi:hypothetical protein
MTAKPRTLQLIMCLCLVMLMTAGCASFRSDLKDGFRGETRPNISARRVSVLFQFSHVRQTLGYDAVPKLENKNQILPGFDDIFMDALREFSNIDQYATCTEYATDVENPERRAQRDSLAAAKDYTIQIHIKMEKRFAGYFLKTLVSTVTLTLLPLPYTQSYGMEARVYDHERKLVATFHRGANLTKWVQPLLIFLYPFHPQERKREEIYLEFLHDLFRQIESERLLGG